MAANPRGDVINGASANEGVEVVFGRRRESNQSREVDNMDALRGAIGIGIKSNERDQTAKFGVGSKGRTDDFQSVEELTRILTGRKIKDSNDKGVSLLNIIVEFFIR